MEYAEHEFNSQELFTAIWGGKLDKALNMVSRATPEQLLEVNRYNETPIMFLFKNVKGNPLQDTLKVAKAILDKLDSCDEEFPLSATDKHGTSALSRAIEAKNSLEEIVEHSNITHMNPIKKKYVVFANDGTIDQESTIKNILEGTKDDLGIDYIIERIAAKTPEKLVKKYAKSNDAALDELLYQAFADERKNPTPNVGGVGGFGLSGGSQSLVV